MKFGDSFYIKILAHWIWVNMFWYEKLKLEIDPKKLGDFMQKSKNH